MKKILCLMLALLMIGPVYEQTVIKTEKAAAQLRFLSARTMDARTSVPSTLT